MDLHATASAVGLTGAESGSDRRARLVARWERTWEAMEEAGYSALLVAGRGVISQYGYLQFIAGYTPVIRAGYALLVPGRDPVFVLPTGADAHEAQSLVGLDVRIAGGGGLVAGSQDLGGTVAALLLELGADGDLGVVGLSSIVSDGDAERLAASLADRRVVDATPLLAELKIHKDADDIRELEATAAIVDMGFGLLLERLRPGATPWELAGEVQGEVRARGARDALVFVGAGPHLAVPNRARPLAPGDLVSALVEIAGPTGYWVEYGGIFALGELKPDREDLARACLDARAAAADLLRPGVPLARVAAAIDERAAAAGARTGIWHGHGVGVDHDLPLIGGAETRTVEPGMALAVHPNFSDRDQQFGAMVTDTYVIHEDKPQRLSGIAQELHRVIV